jgi:hypothetical protein
MTAATPISPDAANAIGATLRDAVTGLHSDGHDQLVIGAAMVGVGLALVFSVLGKADGARYVATLIDGLPARKFDA